MARGRDRPAGGPGGARRFREFRSDDRRRYHCGEPPLYGPLSFTYATASLYYDIPGAGRVGVDLQRAYMLQELLPLNNFHANLLTLRFSRTF
jgi:hypothetical protein